MSDTDNESPIPDNNSNEVNEDERTQIRAKLSNMSFEDLLKLKNEMGTKLYNETVHNAATKKPKTEFKRENKNRPREMSAKIRPRIHNKQVIDKQIARDPRFDPLCGNFDKKSFKKNYKFITDLRKTERDTLREEYNETTDVDRKKQIKYLIQRLENQISEYEKKNKIEQKDYEEKKEIKDKLKRGEKPEFKKKSVKRIESLIEKYETLKKTNKLQKHIEKRTKKMASKERKKLRNEKMM